MDVKTISNKSFPWDKFWRNQRKLFLSTQKQKHEVIWSLFLALHDVIRGKEAVWSWSYRAIVFQWEGLCSLFFKLIEATESQRQIRFCAEAWLGFKRFWRLKQRKGYCGCINGFPFYTAKSEWNEAESGFVNWIFSGYFWESKIESSNWTFILWQLTCFRL